jgi:hypothetical protein
MSIVQQMFNLTAYRRLLLDVLSEYLAGGHVGDTEGALDLGGLRAFSRAGSPHY